MRSSTPNYCLVSLGIDDNDSNKPSLDVYKEHFEAPFIEATEKYYHTESEAFLAENSVSDYLKKAEQRLREEEDRVERFLHTNTRKTVSDLNKSHTNLNHRFQLISGCEQVLIKEHAEIMWEEFQKLLDFDKDEDLQRMYSLLSRIPEGLEPLRKKFEEHVKRAGLSAVQKLVGEGEAGIENLDPKAYVDALLEVHHKNQETVNRSFKGEAGFVASLDKVRALVNLIIVDLMHFVQTRLAASLSTVMPLQEHPQPSPRSCWQSMPMLYFGRIIKLRRTKT